MKSIHAPPYEPIHHYKNFNHKIKCCFLAAKAEYDSVDTRSVSSNVAVSSSARSRRRETVGSTVSSNSKQADKQNDEEIIGAIQSHIHRIDLISA